MNIQYLVFLVFSVSFNLLSTALKFNFFSNFMEYNYELGRKVLVFDHDTLSLVIRSKTDYWS